ncbi:MAG: hypothetical protein AAF548_09890 [Actinomycetota bacterium]
MFGVLSLDGPVRASRWWYLLPGYLTLWSLANGAWSFLDGAGQFDAFGIDITVVTDGDEFVLANSGARYLGIARSAALFLIPGGVSLVWLWRSTRREDSDRVAA